MSICERLKEERLRLGYSQSAFAEIVGASKRTQIGWEQGRSSPSGDSFAIWASIGLDILYVLTGQRSMAVSEQNPRERALLDNYRHCDEEDKKAIERVVLNSAAPKQEVLAGEKGNKKAS